MIIETEDEFEKLKEVGQIVANCLVHMLGAIEPGMTTKELDEIGAKFLSERGAESAPIKMYEFPGTTCISLEHEAAHGIPSATRRIESGNLINIDVSAVKDGIFADTGASYLVGDESGVLKKLCQATRRALKKSIAQVQDGALFNQIGKAIERESARTGFVIIENLCSHGVGRALHEEPKQILSYYDQEDRRRMKKGMVFTIEPFLSTGSDHVTTHADGWTLMNREGHYSAQYEHTIVCTNSKPVIVTQPSEGAAFVPFRAH